VIVLKNKRVILVLGGLFAVLVIVLSLSYLSPNYQNNNKINHIPKEKIDLTIKEKHEFEIKPDIATITTAFSVKDLTKEKTLVKNQEVNDKILSVLSNKQYIKNLKNDFIIQPLKQESHTEYKINNQVFFEVTDIAKISEVVSLLLNNGIEDIETINYKTKSESLNVKNTMEKVISNLHSQAKKITEEMNKKEYSIESININNENLTNTKYENLKLTKTPSFKTKMLKLKIDLDSKILIY
jgi:uncharacterized protein YggE